MRKQNSRNHEKIIGDFRKGGINRRTFIYRLAALGAIAASAPLIYRLIPRERDPRVFSEKEWELVAAVQEHLFPPGDDGPGAGEINARPYLQWVIGDPEMDPEEMEFLKNGFTWIEETAVENFGKSFLTMNAEEREKTLREAESHTWGESFLSKVLLYIFEALLCDPVYGGNQEEIGWKWLEHNPGLPRPTEQTRYGL